MNSKETFIQEALLVHGNKFDYSKVEYVNNKTKVCIICPEHGEFWQTPYKHAVRGQGCPKCARNKKLSTEDFIEKANRVHNFKYDYSKVNYTGSYDKVVIICREHGEFLQAAYHHLSGRGCYECAKNTISSKLAKGKEDFIRKANLKHEYKYSYEHSQYVNRRTQILITCDKHGDFLQVPKDHLSGCGCPKCGQESVAQKLSLTTEEFIQRAKEVHGSTYMYDKCQYINFNTPVLITCRNHGDFYQTPKAHIYDKCGCQQCIHKEQSFLFNKLKEHFVQEDILYEVTNHYLSWLGRKRLDIYFPKYNIAVEYDGEQHFMPIDYFGGEVKFQETVIADTYKNELCAKNGCMLFRIKYGYTDSDFKNLVNKIESCISLRKNNN